MIIKFEAKAINVARPVESFYIAVINVLNRKYSKITIIITTNPTYETLI